MDDGRILVGSHQGAYVIKLTGDVRLSYCTTLDEYVERMFADKDFVGVLVDLSEASNVDSTTLGQLAKLAIQARDKFDLKPVLLSASPDITRIVTSMAFDRIFEIRDECFCDDRPLGSLPAIAGSEADVRAKVMEAHKVLMSLSAHNAASFRALVNSLEAGDN
ncbi:MAG TPA: STAS domain-containing protein [Spongiibacteraceae bacterium]|jgi:anti-anti-sigma factor|nr:STAS domain-containing protein [Spongiibacteraceae bacterium]HUH37351.1 STAS domain-containing protein [Spongiibacteraceae bacterium]